MDLLAHTLWTTAAARKANKLAEKNNKKFKLNLIWTAFWGIFPDLFAFTFPFLISAWIIISSGEFAGFFSANHKLADSFDLAHTLYQYSHSLIIFILVFVIVWIFLKRPPWILFAWLLHILIDIPSHALDFYPTPFLFPISNYHFPYGVRWSNEVFMIVNYSLLLIIWGNILMKKYLKNKPKIS